MATLSGVQRLHPTEEASGEESRGAPTPWRGPPPSCVPLDSAERETDAREIPLGDGPTQNDSGLRQQGAMAPMALCVPSMLRACGMSP